MRSISPPRPSLADRLASQIRDAIVDARFAFGEMLSEENLAEAFGVSRTPIRQALTLLQMEDLVAIVPKSGTYVFTPSLAEISELCEYRAALELQAVSSSAERSASQLVSRLSKLAEQMDQARQDDDMRSYGRLDTDYHLSFFEFCDNRYLERGYRMILGRVAALRTQLAVHTEGEPERSYNDHKAMIELIASRKTARLEKVLFDHIQRTKDNYLRAFAERPGADHPELSQLKRKLRV